MNFKKWINEFNEAFGKTAMNHANYRGGLKMKGTTLLIPEGLEDRSVQLFTAFKLEGTNKKLVWATWILALATIILVGVSIYFQYFE